MKDALREFVACAILAATWISFVSAVAGVFYLILYGFAYGFDYSQLIYRH